MTDMYIENGLDYDQHPEPCKEYIVTVQVNEELHIKLHNGKPSIQDAEQYNKPRHWKTVNWTLEKLIEYQLSGGCVRLCEVNSTNRIVEGDRIYGFCLDLDKRDDEVGYHANVLDTLDNPLTRYAYLGHYSPSQTKIPSITEYSKHRLCFAFDRPIDFIETAKKIIGYFTFKYIGAAELNNPSRYFYGANSMVFAPSEAAFHTAPGIILAVDDILNTIDSDAVYNEQLDGSDDRYEFVAPSNRTLIVYQFIVNECLQGKPVTDLFDHTANWNRRKDNEKGDVIECWEGSPPHRPSNSGKSFVVSLMSNGMILWSDRENSRSFSGNLFDYLHWKKRNFHPNHVRITRTKFDEFYNYADDIAADYGKQLEFESLKASSQSLPGVTVVDKRRKGESKIESTNEQSDDDSGQSQDTIEEIISELEKKLFYIVTSATEKRFTCWSETKQVWLKDVFYPTVLSNLLLPVVKKYLPETQTLDRKSQNIIMDRFYQLKSINEDPRIEPSKYPVFADGIFDTDHNELIPRNHHHIFYSINDQVRIGREYIDEQKVECFRDSLMLWVGNDQTNFDILYYATVALIRNLGGNLQQMIQIKGDGGLGKTQFMKFLGSCLGNFPDRSLIGRSPVFMLNYERTFSSKASPFALSEVESRKLVYLDEIPPKAAFTDTIKEITGSKRPSFSIDIKKLPTRNIRREFAFFCCSNNDFVIRGDDAQHTRRILIIELPWTNPDDGRENALPESLKSMILWQYDYQFVESIVNHALYDFDNNVIDRFDEIAKSAKVKDKINEKIKDNDPFVSYLEEFFEVDPNYPCKMNAMDLYEHFRNWADKERYGYPRDTRNLSVAFWRTADKHFGYNAKYRNRCRDKGKKTWLYALRPHENIPSLTQYALTYDDRSFLRESLRSSDRKDS